MMQAFPVKRVSVQQYSVETARRRDEAQQCLRIHFCSSLEREQRIMNTATY